MKKPQKIKKVKAVSEKLIIKKVRPKKSLTKTSALKRRKVTKRKLVRVNIQDLGTRVVPMRVMRRRSLERMVAFMLVVSLNAFGLFGVGGTLGYYRDTESTTGNTFMAGSVDFSLDVSGWHSTTTAISMTEGTKVKKFINIKPGHSNPFFYYATSTNFVGDEDFCTGIRAWVDMGGEFFYDGSLKNMVTEATSTPGSWRFTFKNEHNLPNHVCNFDIDINGWQTRHNFSEYGDEGYTDTERFSQHFSTWGFRINKVYYDVATDRGEEGINEWVEIYNQTDQPGDISGWQICDNTSCDTLPTTPLIPAYGYALIVATTTTASKDVGAYWYLPDEVTKVDLDDLIGNGLSNDEDMLVLKRPDGVVIDEMNWGVPDEGWKNYSDSVWNPGVEDAPEGSLLARKHPGYDTDTSYEWRVFSPPRLGLIQPEDGGTYTWYWGQSHTIEWLAKNEQGLHEDLGISIFYTQDDNHDDVISDGDTTGVIAEDTENDGIFDWVVPMGFNGQIWIQLVATGPENPMMNTVVSSMSTLFVEEEVIVDIQPLNLMMMAAPMVVDGDTLVDDAPEIVEELPLEPVEEVPEEIVEEEEVVVLDEVVEPVVEIKEMEVVEDVVVEKEVVEESAEEKIVEEPADEEPKVEEKVEVVVEEEKIEEPAEEPTDPVEQSEPEESAEPEVTPTTE